MLRTARLLAFQTISYWSPLQACKSSTCGASHSFSVACIVYARCGCACRYARAPSSFETGQLLLRRVAGAGGAGGECALHLGAGAGAEAEASLVHEQVLPTFPAL